MQPGSTLRSGRRGREFKSRLLDQGGSDHGIKAEARAANGRLVKWNHIGPTHRGRGFDSLIAYRTSPKDEREDGIASWGRSCARMAKLANAPGLEPGGPRGTCGFESRSSQRLSGGMADTPVSGTGERKLVEVRLLSQATLRW